MATNRRTDPTQNQKGRQAVADSMAAADSAAAEQRFERGRAAALKQMNAPDKAPEKARDSLGRFIQSVAKALGMNPAADAIKKGNK